MFKKMKVVGVRGVGFQTAEKPGSKMISTEEFSQVDGGKVTITGQLFNDKNELLPNRVKIVMQASQLPAVKAALFDKLERGEGILEGTFTNLRDHDGDIEYTDAERVDFELTNADGTAAFKFTPAPLPNWIDTKKFGECKVHPVIHHVTEEKREQGRAKMKELIAKRQRG